MRNCKTCKYKYSYFNKMDKVGYCKRATDNPDEFPFLKEELNENNDCVHYKKKWWCLWCK